jgi:hypothetical protein
MPRVVFKTDYKIHKAGGEANITEDLYLMLYESGIVDPKTPEDHVDDGGIFDVFKKKTIAAAPKSEVAEAPKKKATMKKK